MPDKITVDFLISQGWDINEQKPLYTSFIHSKDERLVCSIGKYSEFFIAELHWCNRTPERTFDTVNHNLTTEDYHTIIKLLALQI